VSGRVVVAAVLVAAIAVATATVAELREGHAVAVAADHRDTAPAGRSNAVSASAGLVNRRIVLGRSIDGRTIAAAQLGNPLAARSILVVGCIHGNEVAGIPIARLLAHTTPLQSLNLWIVPNLNPDGSAAGTRQNARAVDLNRNFPYRWQLSGRPGDLTYSGPRPLSEPESRIAKWLIRRIKPRFTVWFHQPLALVDQSGGDSRVERRYARLVGLPLRRLPRYHGTATSWQNHTWPNTTAFVVELPGGRLTARQVRFYAYALLRL
jgi:protein MpaA